MIRIRVGDQYVEFVTEEVLHLTDDPDRAAVFTWEGQVRAEELIRYHQTMDDACSDTQADGYKEEQ